MDINYTYKVINMNTDEDKAEGFVCNAVIALVGTTNVEGVDYEAALPIPQHFTYDETSNLIPYNDLTEEQVIGWVKTIVGENRIERFKITIENKLNAQFASSTKRDLPWA